MKKSLLFLAVGLISLVEGYSQDSTKQLFQLPKIQTIGLYVAPEFQYGQLKSNFTYFGGMSAMVLFNNTFAIGGAMEHSMDRSLSPSGIAPLKLDAAVGGLKLEYILKPQSALHCSFNLLVGGGMARADSGNFNRFDRHRNGDMGFEGSNMNRVETGHRANFFVVQPGAQLEANLFRYVKFFAGANYRFAIKGDHTDALLPASLMQGFSATAGLKIGLFDFNTDRFSKHEEGTK